MTQEVTCLRSAETPQRAKWKIGLDQRWASNLQQMMSAVLAALTEVKAEGTILDQL